jgi:DNA-binding NarL/FixJ family response regulator
MLSRRMGNRRSGVAKGRMTSILLAADGLEIVALVERLKPDVLVTDVALPSLYGLEVARRVRESAPDTGVVILSRYPHEWYVTEALRRGALGYVGRHSDAAEAHRANVMRKLRLRNRAALIRYALSRGVLSPSLASPVGLRRRRARPLAAGRDSRPSSPA